MKKLFSCLTGIEIYQIPEMTGHEIVNLDLESIEDIISGEMQQGYSTPNALYLTTYGFVMALDAGDLGAVTSLFTDEAFVLKTTIEIEVLKEKRELMVNKRFADRLIHEATKIFDKSNDIVIETGNSVEDEFLWKQMMKQKFYALCLLDTGAKVIKNITIPGETKDLYLYADVKLIDKDILDLFKELNELKKTLPDNIDKRFAFRTLRVQHLNDIKHSEQ